MLTTVFLSALLMLGGLGGVAAFNRQVHGKSIHSDKTLPGSNDGTHTVRTQPYQQTKNEISRSLDLESFSVHVTPTTSKISLPSIIRLFPPTAKPFQLHANMPMRFGRESVPGDDSAPNSTPNMPQRFGRSWEMCAKCLNVREAQNPILPQRLGRRSPYWSLFRTLDNTWLLNTGLHWAEDFDFTTSSEEVEMQEKSFKG
ncbi:pro-FMRFamide-related neuropeptide VF [Epinephelus fuscoguttatus]|uniref:pro-FMRFamide-related neuropeptide VF n=1 Tax=Epinephelus fuscoguttatus TaxID=293821 RepID=UPI0020CFF5CC|nr:pro-FMRFamide-related neuropeptide VF [Epinephelus fuscoguttatus]